MAKTLWPFGSIVCYEEFDDIPYRLMTRVTEDHKKYIPILDILTLDIEWVFLSDLKYLDKPETYEEYYYAVRRKNSKPIRRTKKSSNFYRSRPSQELEWEQVSGSQSS